MTKNNEIINLDGLNNIEDDIIKPDPTTITEIREELTRLISLINRLKDLNEAEAKIINLKKEKLNLIKLIKNP